MKDETKGALAIAGMACAFGSWALYLGHDSTIIASVFGLFGALAGYMFGKRQSAENEN